MLLSLPLVGGTQLLAQLADAPAAALVTALGLVAATLISTVIAPVTMNHVGRRTEGAVAAQFAAYEAVADARFARIEARLDELGRNCHGTRETITHSEHLRPPLHPTRRLRD